MNKQKTKLTLSIDDKVLVKYKTYCMKKGLIVSKQVENFMSDELKK